MNLFSKGDLLACVAKFGDQPSEWTGKLALILECLETDNPFFEDADDIMFAKVSGKAYNSHAAKDVRYKVLVENKIMFMNHSCFLENVYNWSVTDSEKNFIYL